MVTSCWLQHSPNVHDATQRASNARGDAVRSASKQLQRAQFHLTRTKRPRCNVCREVSHARSKQFPVLSSNVTRAHHPRVEILSEALRDSRSLATFFLAAAVSDCHTPENEKSQRKIQSQEGGNESGMTLKLRPVPKAARLLATKWAPESHLVSFKLKTDTSILRRKAKKVVQKR